jgi:hypothetical protein
MSKPIGRSVPSATGISTVMVASLIFLGAASAQEVVQRGEPFALGKGAAQAWTITDAVQRPIAIGVSISESAMSSVDHSHGANLSMPLPGKPVGGVFDHIYLNWQPHGHPPVHLYGVPHFDVHFYKLDEAARQAISPADPTFDDKTANYPSGEFLPADYAPPPEPEAVPFMGVHWSDRTSPVFNGEPFTEVFILGTWNGELAFWEPMITAEVFHSRETQVRDIKQPAHYARPGYYPTSYRIDFDATAKEHRVYLEGFVWRD